MATINEIAEKANVSRTTVSRVLNNSGYVSEDARTRVLRVIEETGYIPSENAKSLRTKKTKVIGVILPKISTETSSRLVKGMDMILAERGYQILLANTNLEPEKEIEYLSLLKSRRVDGIILSATNVNSSLIEEIRKLKIPFVIVGQRIAGLTTVVYDDYEASKSLVRMLAEKGHERIAFIGVDEKDESVGFLRKKGYFDAMEENQLSIENSWVQKGVFNVESGYSSMEKIVTESIKTPTAVVTVTDRLAIGAMQYLKKCGFNIPEDVAIAGMGDSEMASYVTPSLTTIDFHNKEAGMEAARRILALIEGESVEENVKVLNYRLIIRESV